MKNPFSLVIGGLLSLAAVWAAIEFLQPRLNAIISRIAVIVEIDERVSELEKEIQNAVPLSDVHQGNPLNEETLRKLAEEVTNILRIEHSEEIRREPGPPGQDSPSAEEIARVLVRDYAEELRGPEEPARPAGDIGGAAPTAEEIARVLIRDYADVLQGPPGPAGPRGEKGDSGGMGAPSGSADLRTVRLPRYDEISADLAQQSVSIIGFDIYLKDCLRRASDVSCSFLVDNVSGSEQRLTLTSNANDRYGFRAYTPDMQRHFAKSVKLTNTDVAHNGTVSYVMPQGIKTEAEYSLIGIDTGEDGFVLVEFYVANGPRQDTARFSQVPIENP